MHILYGLTACLVLLFVYDHWISKDNILRNFPIIGHLRYVLIQLGPELRQYIVAHNREELPFNREEREWIYRSADGKDNFFGFGTDDQIYAIGYPIIKHSTFPIEEPGVFHKVSNEIPSMKILGETHNRPKAWRPQSIVNISAMSFGALGENAVTALNKGAKIAGCYQNTGEGGLAPYHKQGADVIYQLGTGYFGSRDTHGQFSMEKFLQTVSSYPHVRGIEIKLSQGAKPGKGGVLPAPKVTSEIAKIRGVMAHENCISPSGHSAFKNVRGLIQFIETIARETGLPVGIKSAVGRLDFWKDLAVDMKSTGRGPDWITIDGGEGGTGAAPLTFTDHVSLPFKMGFARVYKIFMTENMENQVAWIGSGKLGFPDRAIVAFAMGVDLINMARESMLSIGCIQAQRCHTGKCPAGITTQNKRLQHGLDPDTQALRYARFCQSLRHEILAVTHACGYEHPAQFKATDIELNVGAAHSQSLDQVFGYAHSRVWRPISAAS